MSLVEIRKLRKKIRQIECLEQLDRDLTVDEVLKINKKPDLRTRLQLLVATGVPDLSTSVVDENNININSAEESASDSESNLSNVSPEKLQTKRFYNELSNGSPSLQTKQLDVDNVASETASDKCCSKLFTVQSLTGHNGIVTALAMSNSVLVSASQDTTVKVWDLVTGTELHSLGGHKQTVTAVMLLSTETSALLVDKLVAGHSAETEAELQLVLSASLDCNVCIWSLHSGHCLHSVYTFHPLTCLSYIEHDSLIVTGSDGGKLEVWDPAAEMPSPLCSVSTHNSAVVQIVLEGGRIYCGTSDGRVTAFDLTKCDSSLCESFDSSRVQDTLTGRLRPVLCLAVTHGSVYTGDSSANIRVINCSQGTVHKLTNHMTDFGSTDAIFIADNILVMSGYDIDNGLGYINVRSVPSERYEFTLCDERTPQIRCITCRRSATGALVIATGGHQLKLWTQSTAISEQPLESGGITVESVFIPRFNRDARDSDTEHSSDDELSESASADEMRLPWSHDTKSEEPQRGLWSWCTIL